MKLRLFYSKQKLYYDKIVSLENQIKAELECPQTSIVTSANSAYIRKKNVENEKQDTHVLLRDVVGLREKNHKDLVILLLFLLITLIC
jgi:hypothetical protein